MVARHLPAGRHRAGDRHLKFHNYRDNLTNASTPPSNDDERRGTCENTAECKDPERDLRVGRVALRLRLADEPTELDDCHFNPFDFCLGDCDNRLCSVHYTVSSNGRNNFHCTGMKTSRNDDVYGKLIIVIGISHRNEHFIVVLNERYLDASKRSS